VERAEVDGLFIAEAGRVVGGFCQWKGRRVVAVANGGALANVGAVEEGDVEVMASAKEGHAREEGRDRAGGVLVRSP
jgi:hypothetical protein